ncbi:MAG: NUDIX hydrolase [Acidimicrobiales bacterium]
MEPLVGPAPWGRLPKEARRNLSLEHLVGALRATGALGALPAVMEPTSGLKAAAVLVALFEADGEARVVLTRRSAELRSHTGEVSLPGGALDPGEAPAQAALREAAEEVGLDPGPVALVGCLAPRLTARGTTQVLPVIATLGRRPELSPNASEVARIFDVSFSQLVADGVFAQSKEGLAWPPGSPRSAPVWCFALDGEVVWGLTARILYELALVVLGLCDVL